jgi:Uncharacterized conserved protein (DUF2190)
MKTQAISLTISMQTLTDAICRRFFGFNNTMSTAGAKALGVVECNTGAGGTAPINVTGLLLVQAGGAINAGAEVQSNEIGQAITLGAGKSNGFAVDAAVQAGDLIRIIRGI